MARVDAVVARGFGLAPRSIVAAKGPLLTSFTLSDELEELRTSVRRLAEDKIAPNAAACRRGEEYPWDVVARVARRRASPGLAFPEEYGGQGGGFLAHAICVEEVARVLRVVVAVHVHLEARR